MKPQPIRARLPQGSPVARVVATRLEDYLRELDLPLSAFWPLADRLPHAADRVELERRRVRIVLSWGMAVVAPAAATFLNLSLSEPENARRLLQAGAAVSGELRRAAHLAQIDNPQARELAVGDVWNAVFVAFTVNHARPMLPAVLPVLTSGHELLARLIDLSATRPDAPRQAPAIGLGSATGDPERDGGHVAPGGSDGAADDLRPWTPVSIPLGATHVSQSA